MLENAFYLFQRRIINGTISGCDGGSIGVYAATLATPRAGAWVYGVKPASSVKCTDPNAGECILTRNKEVYYADKGSENSGTNKRYQFSSKDQAESYAKQLGGTLATLEQIRDAHSRGIDVCWLGWASDSKIYTISQSSHGVTSGCDGGSIGVYAATLATPMAGAWVYGFKPASSSVKNCTARNVGECILPFSTKNNKWSQN